MYNKHSSCIHNFCMIFCICMYLKMYTVCCLVYMYVCVRDGKSACVCVCVCVCMCVYMCVSTSACMCSCVIFWWHITTIKQHRQHGTIQSWDTTQYHREVLNITAGHNISTTQYTKNTPDIITWTAVYTLYTRTNNHDYF